MKAPIFSQAVTKYEWGNPANCLLPEDASLKEQKLAAASFRWRKNLQKDHHPRPFEGIRAILHTSPTRTEAFSRLLHSGKGSVVVDEKPPYKEPTGATHVIVEFDKQPRSVIDFVGLAARRVAVISQYFIGDILLSELPPKVDDYLVDEFKPFWCK